MYVPLPKEVLTFLIKDFSRCPTPRAAFCPLPHSFSSCMLTWIFILFLSMPRLSAGGGARNREDRAKDTTDNREQGEVGHTGKQSQSSSLRTHLKERHYIRSLLGVASWCRRVSKQHNPFPLSQTLLRKFLFLRPRKKGVESGQQDRPQDREVCTVDKEVRTVDKDVRTVDKRRNGSNNRMDILERRQLLSLCTLFPPWTETCRRFPRDLSFEKEHERTSDADRAEVRLRPFRMRVGIPSVRIHHPPRGRGTLHEGKW